jgi:hypothetical protein
MNFEQRLSELEERVSGLEKEAAEATTAPKDDTAHDSIELSVYITGYAIKKMFDVDKVGKSTMSVEFLVFGKDDGHSKFEKILKELSCFCREKNKNFWLQV